MVFSDWFLFSAPQENARRQKAARDSKVVMYRKYRVGELPDIQIKHSELIRPFQALAQVINCPLFVSSVLKPHKMVGHVCMWSTSGLLLTVHPMCHKSLLMSSLSA